MVSLQHVIDMGDHLIIYDFCAGAIISPYFVLTAGVHIWPQIFNLCSFVLEFIYDFDYGDAYWYTPQ